MLSLESASFFFHMENKFGKFIPSLHCKLSWIQKCWYLNHEAGYCFLLDLKYYEIVYPVYALPVKFWKMYLEPDTPGRTRFPMSVLYLSRLFSMDIGKRIWAFQICALVGPVFEGCELAQPSGRFLQGPLLSFEGSLSSVLEPHSASL
jgi:hypothetical protein